MLLNIVIYGLLLWLLPDVAFLNHMAITFVALVVVMAVMTAMHPLAEPVTLPVNEDLDVRTSPAAKAWGLAIVVVTVALYVVFW